MAKRLPGKLIPFAKIDDETVRRIVQGFACAESIAEIATATGISEKTCRPIVLALRPRLLKEPFDTWREAYFWRVFFDRKLEAIVLATVYGCLAKCYFNRGCYTNYQQGRRKTRLCRACPIKALELDEAHLEAALYHIDLVYTFYFALGLGGERDIGKLTQFQLRLTHTQVIGEAFEATRKHDDGTPDFSDSGPRSARALYDKLIADLRAEPLSRKTPPINPTRAPFEDLSWLDA